MNFDPPVELILVPQGQEYQAVCRGLQLGSWAVPVVAVPVGTEPLKRYLRSWQPPNGLPQGGQPRVLLMGLCGSLTARYGVGDVVVYSRCVSGTQPKDDDQQTCDPVLTALLQRYLNLKGLPVTAVTSDRLIFSAVEKQHLAEKYQAEVVDMEGLVALQGLTSQGFAVSMVRVVSDDCHHNLPDLSTAFSPDGSLLPIPLTLGMARQPLAAWRLIRGSLQGLKILQQVTTQIFTQPQKN
jgi:hypothetical protein